MGNHPGSIDRHGKTWRIRLSVGGVRHTFKLDGETPRSEVEQYARERDTELRRRLARGVPGVMRLSVLLDKYEKGHLPGKSPRTQETYQHSLDAFRTFFVRQLGDPKVHVVRSGHVQNFLVWRRTHSPDGSPRTKPLAPRTVAKDRAVLHNVFALAETLELVEGNPVAKVPRAKGDTRQPIILSDPQYERLIDACADRPMLRFYVLVLGEAGLRCNSEALWLRWSDIDLEARFLTVESVRKGRRTKSGKSRRVPLTRRLRDAARAHIARFSKRTYGGERSPWVFHHLLTQRGAVAGQRLKSLYKSYKRAAERANLPADLNQHDLRHRRVTKWLAEDKNPVLVQRAMGHADLATTMEYTHLVDEHLLALVEEPE